MKVMNYAPSKNTFSNTGWFGSLSRIASWAVSGALVRVLDDAASLVFDSHAVWPQIPHLPLSVCLAIDALTATLPEATSYEQSL